MSEVKRKGQLAKEASFALVGLTTEQKNEALQLIADQLRKDEAYIIEENKKDLQLGKEKGFTESLLDRLMLDQKRIHDMADAIGQLIELKDPIGDSLEKIEKENGLHIEKVRVPIGVVGMIYEARPNVTVDAATLSLKTGNAVILRGSSSAFYSNVAIVATIHKAMEKSVVPINAVQLIEDTSRETAKELFNLNEYLDVLIPRGGKNLIDTVVRESSVPVIETGAGNCHVFVDATASYDMVEPIVINAKVQRPSVCNSIETLLVHQSWFEQYGKRILDALLQHHVEIHGDQQVCEVCPQAVLATEVDWETEYSTLTISVKVIGDVKEAVNHINQYGTKHSEAIVTEDQSNAAYFLNRVDASAVYHNASTRFTDGFEFGYGAEIGISTQKLHARGPMGLNALTSSKFVIRGEGQIRG